MWLFDISMNFEKSSWRSTTNSIDLFVGVVALFTLPKVYETNKAQIDQNLALVQSKINDLTTK